MTTSALAQQLREAQHVVVFTGAGASAESGIPTFRDALSGLWEKFDPAQLATAEAYRADPNLCWGWYEWRRQKVVQAQPNGAHLAIAELANHVPKLTVVTQNVDDLHERAGSQDVIHLHGSLHSPRCIDCGLAHALPLAMETDACPRLSHPKYEVMSSAIHFRHLDQPFDGLVNRITRLLSHGQQSETQL